MTRPQPVSADAVDATPNEGRPGEGRLGDKSRAAYGGWCLFLVLLMTGTLAIIGLGMDWLRQLTPGTLYVALTASSLLGATLAGVFVRPWVVRRGERLALIVLLYLAWRCSYFPLLQLASLAAGSLAGLAIRLPLVTPTIYPALLTATGLFHLAVGLLAAWPLAARRPLLLPVAWSPLVLAGLLSICSWDDVHPIPDRGYAAVPTTSELPTTPSLAGILRQPPPSAWNERLRLSLAQWVYAQRDNSPWSAVVQGTLARGLARAGANASAGSDQSPGEVSSTRFIQLYYSAMIAAHEFVGHERLMVRRPPRERVRPGLEHT